jgi:hypothetical protein
MAKCCECELPASIECWHCGRMVCVFHAVTRRAGPSVKDFIVVNLCPTCDRALIRDPDPPPAEVH